jgi:hypothetical protein
MPILREWMILPPAYWSEAQTQQWLDHCLQATLQGMRPVIQIASPSSAVGVLMAAIHQITMANPAYTASVLDGMVRLCEALEKSLPKETRH